MLIPFPTLGFFYFHIFLRKVYHQEEKWQQYTVYVIGK